MTLTQPPPTIRRDWVSKALAGALLGLAFAFGCSAAFERAPLGVPPPVKAQLAMWVVMPIWLNVLSGCFFFPSGKLAWLWLGIANVVVFGIFLALRLL